MPIQPSGNDSYGALSGSGKNVVGDEIRRGIHDHEGICDRDGNGSGGKSSTSGPGKYVLFAVAFVAILFLIFVLISKVGG